MPARAVTYREGERGRVGLVLDGLFRVFLQTRGGRQVTTRYARTGDTMGLSSALAGPLRAARPGPHRRLGPGRRARRPAGPRALEDAALAWAVAEENARRVYDVVEELAGNTFGSVRQRVARHLLDLTAATPAEGELLAPVSQQELANAVGTVREVVSRVLQDLRAAGIVRQAPAGVVVLDAAKLFAEAEAAD